MRRQVRVTYTGAIFAALLFVMMISFIEIHESDRFAGLISRDDTQFASDTVDAPVDVSAEPDCAMIESEFAARLEQSRSCQIDTDCTLTRLECPFECVSSVSASILDELKREETSFQESCGRCVSECPQTLEKWRAACVRNRCIVLDRSIDELEEATLRLINQPGRTTTDP